jgi:hypothetical protein
MTTLGDATATIAAWAATIVVLLLLAAVLWSFLRRRGTVDGLSVTSPADEVRRTRLDAADAAPGPGPAPGPAPGHDSVDDATPDASTPDASTPDDVSP